MTQRSRWRLERRSAGFAAGILILIIHAILLKTAPLLPAHRLLFLFFFLSTILLPGYLVSLIVFPGTSSILRTLISFIIGSALIFIILLLIALLRWDIRYAGIISPIVSAVLMVKLFFNEPQREENGIARLNPESDITIFAVGVALIINFLLNIYMIPKYGIIGAGIATSISKTILTLILVCFFWRQHKCPSGSCLYHCVKTSGRTVMA